MKATPKYWFIPLAAIAAMVSTTQPVQAGLLAYEPFTNAPGTAVIGSTDGFGFSGSWQANSSGGVATNTDYPLSYTDTAGHTLVTRGGAGFFQGLTSANTSMQPIRLFAFGRGTNGTDGVTTWISFLAVRQGPAVTGNNPYPRGANVPHDINAGGLQKLAIGNSSGAATNTVGLIPLGNSANLKPSTALFSVTNFIVVRIDHVAGAANDNAYLFVNPALDAEPSLSQADTNSLGGFDFSFDRLRVFAGGNASASQPYAELVVDEYRIGETFADVAPYAPPAPSGPLVITQVWLVPGGIAMSGTGGSAAGTYYVLASSDPAVPVATWPAIATNLFDAAGDFACTNPAGQGTGFYRLLTGGLPPPGPSTPYLTAQPQNQSVTEGDDAGFSVTADGTAPLHYQWYFNTNTLLSGATGASLTVADAQAADAGTYSVVVTNALGSVTSVYATLTVNPAPVAPFITAQPQSLTVTQGNNASFSVTVEGTTPLRYQWYFNTNTTLANATNASFTIVNAQTTNAGAYSVLITNAAGSVISSHAVLTVLVPPYIVTPPQSQSVMVSNNVTFTVTAGGTAPLRYQWYFNTNTPLANATNTSLTITSAQTTNAGGYSVVVTNTIGSITSAVATLTVNATVDTNGAYFVSPSGSDSNPGTITQPFLTISKGLTTIANNGLLYLRGGTYSQSSNLTLSRTGTTNRAIRIWAYPGEVPVVNGVSSASDLIKISGNWYHLKGIEVKNATHNGINISGHSNVVENCAVHDNGNTGLHITGGQSGSNYPSYNLITNCDAYMNYDPPIGGNADGFSTKWQVGPGNVFTGCRAWNNSDDGWDLWMGTSTVVIENCWAFRNGVDSWFSGQFDGNGNGFKLGGNNIGTPHIVRNCVSFDNAIVGSHGAGRGFDENNNLSGQTLYNCVSYRNMGNNYHFSNTVTNGQHIIRNCISYVGNVNITSGTRDHNSWQGFTVTDADFLSLDTSFATASRNPDGSLPVTSLFRLATGSPMIDAGVDVNLPYNGTAPDLGAFETGP